MQHSEPRSSRAVIGTLVVAIVVAIVFGCLARVGAAAGNAAAWYERAAERIAGLTDAEWSALESFSDPPGQTPSPQVREILSRAAPAIEAMLHAARTDGYDRGLDYSQGFELALPHLAQMRNMARVLRADAQVRLHDGDSAGAVGRIGAIYRVGMHLSGERIVISSLVANVTFDIGDEATQGGVDRGALNAGDAAALLRSLEDFDAHDPFEFVEAVAMEQSMTTDWMAERYADSETRAAEIAGLFGDGSRRAAEIAGMSDEEFAADLGRYDEIMGEVVLALEDPDEVSARARLDEIGEALDAGEYGILARVMLFSFEKLFERMIASRKALAERRALLEELAQGVVLPMERANAAFVWAEAIARLGACDRDDVERGLAWALDGATGADDEVTAWLMGRGELLDLARSASAMARCDFAVLRADEEIAPQVCAPYVAGMHEVLGVVLADAKRALGEADREEAAARLAVVLRAVGQLTDDAPLPSALVAHDAAGRVARLIAGCEWSEDARTELRSAVRSIAKKDPFGWIGSVQATREAVGRWMGRQAVPERIEERTERRATIAAVVRTWNADELFAVLLMLDALAAAGDDDAVPRAVTRISRLLDGAEVEIVRALAPEVAAAIGRGVIDVLPERDVPTPADADARRRAARADLRGLVNAVRESREPEAPPNAAVTP